MNLGLLAAKGELIAYLCDDDWFYEHKLDIMDKFFVAHPGCMIAFGKQILFEELNGNKLIKGIRDPGEDLMDAYKRVDHSSVVHRRECYDIVGPWDDSREVWLEADAQYWRKLTAQGWIFSYIPEVLDAHCFNRGSVTTGMRYKIWAQS
mgnify:CR=1 FL=1